MTHFIKRSDVFWKVLTNDVVLMTGHQIKMRGNAELFISFFSLTC